MIEWSKFNAHGWNKVMSIAKSSEDIFWLDSMHVCPDCMIRRPCPCELSTKDEGACHAD